MDKVSVNRKLINPKDNRSVTNIVTLKIKVKEKDQRNQRTEITRLYFRKVD